MNQFVVHGHRRFMRGVPKNHTIIVLTILFKIFFNSYETCFHVIFKYSSSLFLQQLQPVS